MTNFGQAEIHQVEVGLEEVRLTGQFPDSFRGRRPEPIWVLLIEFTVLMRPFRLEPGSIFETATSHKVGEWFDPIREFCRVALAPVPNSIPKVALIPSTIDTKIF